MKDVVLLTESGGTLGFTIQPSILRKLDLKWKDPVEFDIINENGDITMSITRPLKKMGKGSMGIGIRLHIVKNLNLKPSDIIQVDIRKG